MIEIHDLWHQYPTGKYALSGVDLSIEQGEFVALIGQNGAGKTTLVKHLNGLLKASRGTVRVGGLDPSRHSTAKLARLVGFVFQNPDHQIFCASVYDEVAFGPRRLGCSPGEVQTRTMEALEAVDLDKLREIHPYSLSKGQRQRVAFACVLAMKPQVLVVDEPTTGQDYRQSRQIMSIIEKEHRRGSTIIIVTHDMTIVAEYAERTVVLGGGKILADGPTRVVLNQEEILSATNLKSPQITRITRAMWEDGGALTVDEAVERYESRYAERA